MPKSLSLDLENYRPELVGTNSNGQIEPQALLEGGFVRVCYEGMLGTDRIRLFWEGLEGEYAPIDPLDGVDEGFVEFHISPFYVSVRIDRYTHFHYIVTRDEEDFQSPTAEVYIRWPKGLPTPTFVQASNDILDLSLLCDEDPIVRVDPWIFMDPIQVAQLYVSGTKFDDSDFYERFFLGENITEQDVQNGWTRQLPGVSEILCSGIT